MEVSQKDVEIKVLLDVWSHRACTSNRESVMARAKKARARKFVRPTYGALQRAQLSGSVLEKVVVEGYLPRAMLNAELRVLHSFARARSAPGRRETRGYILGAGDRPSDVAYYIISHMSDVAAQDIFSSAKLKDGYGAHIAGECGEVVFRVVFDLILQQIVTLIDEESITYFAGNGEWRISQTALEDRGYRRFAQRVVSDTPGRSDLPRSERRPKMHFSRSGEVAKELRGEVEVAVMS